MIDLTHEITLAFHSEGWKHCWDVVAEFLFNGLNSPLIHILILSTPEDHIIIYIFYTRYIIYYMPYIHIYLDILLFYISYYSLKIVLL